MKADDEQELLRSVALQNANSILRARQRAEEELLAAKEALRQSNDQLKQVLESITDGFVLLDRDWRITYLNPKGAELVRPLGKSRESLLGRNHWEEFPDAVGTPIEEAYRRAVADGVTVDLEVPYPALNCWFHIRAYPSPSGLSVFFHDITLRKAAAASLEAERNVLGIMASGAPLAAVLEGIAREVESRSIAGVRCSVGADGAIECVYPDGRSPGPADERLLALARDLSTIAVQSQASAEALRWSEEQLRATFEQAAVGIASATLDGRIAFTNRKFCELMGYPAEELMGRDFVDLTHPDDAAATTQQMKRLLSGEQRDYSIEKRYLRRDGSSFWSNATVTLLRDAEGKPLRFVGVIEDITARRKAQDSERHALAEAERAGQMKDEFLATLSHELRTPISAILGWTHLLRVRPPAAAELGKGLEIIERNARLQVQLVEDLIDMNRITSGNLRLDVQAVMPVNFIEAALETVRPAADAKGIRIERTLDPAAGPVSGDAARLQQVVWNLLNNAIKFTPKDGKLHVVLQRVNSHVEISVADNGAGIEPQFLEHVFERFRQADASTTRRFGGLGLGLSIVKNLVELHGGTVRARSPGLGMGSTFIVALPAGAVQQPSSDTLREHPRTPSGELPDFAAIDLSGVKVLVVDDQPDACELVARLLSECGATVVTAPDAQQALALLQDAHPDVLLSDIGMPGMDGYELLRRVRSLDAARGGCTPAIAMTAFARSEDRTRALRAGFQVHVAKPVEPSELVATVASVAGRASRVS